MILRRVLYVAVLLLSIALPAHAQECGNVNGTGQIDISDIAYLFDYFYMGGAPWTPRMDMDDRSGVAHGDIVRLVDNIFVQWPNGVYDCTPAQTYSFAPSPNDTLFIPQLTTVPDGINEVTLTIRGSLQPGAAGVCVFLQIMPGSSGGIQYVQSVYSLLQNSGIGVGSFWNYDKTKPCWGFAKYQPEDVLAGSQILHSIKFGRVVLGSTGADLMLVENQIDQYRRICISRDGDLVVPTIVYYEHQFPPDTLKMSVSNLAYDAAAGKLARDTFSVSITSSGSTVQFDLTAVEPWIRILGASTGLTTPVTVQVTADATTLPEGNYASELTFANVSSALGVVTPQASLPVSFAVGPPISYPPGDVNCNGLVDLTDLSMIIAYLLGFTQSLPVCY